MTSEDLERLQALFQIGEYNPITLRAIGPSGTHLPTLNFTFRATDYPSIEARWTAFAEQALALNSNGHNIYTCLNPIRSDFDGDAVKDADIECRRLLLIDLDRHGTHRAPASDDEIRLAFEVADRIETWFHSRTGAQATRVLSGNGRHLYYKLEDLPNNRTSHDYCRNLLKGLAREFDTTAIKVDTTVHNASRITKVPGTIARKGKATEDRPFRRAMFL